MELTLEYVYLWELYFYYTHETFFGEYGGSFTNIYRIKRDSFNE
jgi:hypothetical protein